jgi:hypothetical protein
MPPLFVYFRFLPVGLVGTVTSGSAQFGQKLLADAQTVEHGLGNTRAVPLVRKNDAHQGRVSFLPKFEASQRGEIA